MASSLNWQQEVPVISKQTGVSPDLSLISELLETIERSPPDIEARKLLAQHYMTCGWLEAARDTVSELLSIVPKDSDAQQLHKELSQKEDKAAPAQQKPTPRTPTTRTMPTTGIKNLDKARSQLSKGYKALFSKAKVLHWEMNIPRGLFQQNPQKSRSTATFERRNGAVGYWLKIALPLRHHEPRHNPNQVPLQKVARQMQRNRSGALDIAIQDLTNVAHWLRSRQPAGDANDDAVREALVKRTQALISSLPLELQPVASTAQMHVEHEVLRRTYICSETMYGDPVAEIPRDRFWVSEDGYPWDMAELAQALTSNGGVMRNPLSRQLFNPSDVRAIVQHPLGKPLAALQVAQSELSRGVRPQTVDQLARMSAILLADYSADQIASRHVIDEFMTYVATLPEAEQKALDGLRVPATDSHTGLAFDFSIGEAVRDAQGNRVCIHKIGDFLGQAAKHLRQK